MKTFKFLLVALLMAGTLAFKGAEKAQITTFMVDTEQSEIKWNGKKVTGEHFGNINLASGSLIWNNDQISGGEFVIDMSSITCSDLTDAGTNAKLVNHLKSDDFFGVEKFPNAKFVITSINKDQDDTYNVTGDLTIKENTNEISFPAQINMQDKKLNATANITIDRSKYDVRYGSGSFFDNLGDKMIYDDFTLDLNLVASVPSESASK